MTERVLPIVLRATGVCVILDGSGPSLPRVLHWGADPGPLDPAALEGLADHVVGAVPSGPRRALDFPLFPAEGDLWSGTPGLRGHREGVRPFPRLAVTAIEQPGIGRVIVRGGDPAAGLEVVVELVLEPGGLLRSRTTLTNEPTEQSGDAVYTLDGLTTLMPVPAQARELLDLTGRWAVERRPQRSPFHHGTRLRASRRGRTGHDATLVLCAGTPGFGFRHGEVWAAHVAWSGDHTHLAERLPEGAGSGGTGVIGGGELLLPGEVRLARGESYTTPWICFAYSDEGLDGVSRSFHRYLRSRPQHVRGPRPLVLNTWEAVYFDHGFARLEALAQRAAEVGVERFVLDDGWFLGRRDDNAGLGDWYVDPAVWPGGLKPLADRVHDLGMQFGLWVEPEMVNPDSDLARNHPEWVLAEPGRWPPTVRNQLVLDVAHPQAWAYLLERLDALVGEIGVDYLKWDHNRDLHEAVHLRRPAADSQAGPRPVAGVHTQTLAAYELLDALRARHPRLEIESCASGGGRVDLGILEHTDRIWGSDSNDAHDRQSIQRWTAMLVPPELVGSHVGPPSAHVTGRTAGLTFRALTALFGHAGIEWDITTCTEQELQTLQAWAALYKELRGLLHSGDVVRADHPDDGTWLHGVVAPDRAEAVFCYLRLATSPDGLPARLRLPGLDPAAVYRVVRRDDAGRDDGHWFDPPWWQRGWAEASGQVLAAIGLAAPDLRPDEAVLLHVTRR
jgi:alpha-galactosidase